MNRDSSPAHSSRPGSRPVWVGTLALLVVVAALAASVTGIRRARASFHEPSNAALLRRQAEERRKSEHALTIVSSLATAVDSLARLKTAGVAAPEPAVDPPPPEDFASPTACMLSYLPAVDAPPASLDFVCEETDLWSIEWKVRARLVNRTGDGAKLWSRLGQYSLAAVATMRKGCCVDPPYVQAKVPGLWCGILRDTLRDFHAAPTPGNVHAFETQMTCLSERGMRLPPHFSTPDPDKPRQAFGEFLRIARSRTKPASATEGPE